MRKRYVAALLVVVTVAVRPARGDGLVYRLPNDGIWATYLMEASSSVEGQVLEKVKTVIRVASVGKAVAEGEACRWVEILGRATKESTEDGPEGKTRVRAYDERVHKLLIPEKYLAEGETPLDHVIRGWTRRGKRGSQRIGGSAASLRSLALLLYGPLTDAKALPEAEVEGKLGKVPCAGVAGTLEIELPGVGKQRVTVENRVHPDSPFGLVTSRCTFETPLQRRVGNIEEGTVKVELTLKLTDYGDDATSRIPDAE